VGAEETRAPFGALALLAVLAVRRRRLSARS
jgi:MYXO-CTERM domain-containing protein